MHDSPDQRQHIVGLPDNAYRPLEPGEEYRPLVPAETTVPEVTLRTVMLGLAMTMLFSAASAFIALKLGQGIEDLPFEAF